MWNLCKWREDQQVYLYFLWPSAQNSKCKKSLYQGDGKQKSTKIFLQVFVSSNGEQQRVWLTKHRINGYAYFFLYLTYHPNLNQHRGGKGEREWAQLVVLAQLMIKLVRKIVGVDNFAKQGAVVIKLFRYQMIDFNCFDQPAHLNRVKMSRKIPRK